jgi:hypothetical protein
MIVEDHDMSDCLATYAYKLRPDREASLLFSQCGIRQPVGSNHHHSFLKRSKIDISQNVKFLFVCFERSTQHDHSAMFVVESTAAFCLGASGANRRTSALERGPQPIPEEVFIAKVFAPCDERLRVRFPKQQSGYLAGPFRVECDLG